MEITDVRIRKVTGGGKLKAFVSITFDDIFVVHDLKIIEGDKGVFVAMPSRKTPSGEFRDTAHPIKTEGRRMIQGAVLAKYREMYPGELPGDSESSTSRSSGPDRLEAASPRHGESTSESPSIPVGTEKTSPGSAIPDRENNDPSVPVKNEGDSDFSPF